MTTDTVHLNVKLFIFLVIQFYGFCTGSSYTQAQDLLQSRQSSYYTYIFKLSNQEAEHLYQDQPRSIAKSYFHTLVDSFPTDSGYYGKLPLGHYLRIFATENQQVSSLYSVQNLQLHVLNNDQDLLLQIVDSVGNVISDAKVRIGSKNIPFNPVNQTYSKRKSNKDGLLVVNHHEMVSFFELGKSRNNPWVKRNGRKLLYNTPLQFVWRPIHFIAKAPVDSYQSIKYGYPQGSIYHTAHFFEKAYHSTACFFDEGHCDWRNFGRKYPQGFMVFNKPKYLPQDSVFFKAFIANHKGKPKHTQAKVYLIGGSDPILLGKLQAYRKGAFEYQFHLHDSLDLRLDKSYRVELRDTKERQLLSNRFFYEAYELNKISLQLEPIKHNHHQGEILVVNITAKDDNDLLVKDARIEAILSPSQPTTYHQPELFVPDTLAFMLQNLRPDIPTELSIDPKDFPAADFTYTVDVKLLTGDNETIQEQIHLTYTHFGDPFDWDMGIDSITFKAKASFINPIDSATVVGFDKFGNEVAVLRGKLPLKTPIQPHFSSYQVASDGYSQIVSLTEEPPLVQVFTERTPDQLQLLVNNPRQVPIYYYLFKRNKLIDSGYGTDIAIARNTRSRQNHFVNINYLWAGEMVKETYGIPLRKKRLTIQVEEPPIISPGQEATINLQVTDYKNNPVPDVDLTAFSLTKKFNYSPPSVPNFKNSKTGKHLINSFSVEPPNTRQIGQELGFRTWQVLAHIDSIAYYKFLFPGENRYEFRVEDPEEITQFAPFLFINGQPQSAAIIYVDNVPVFFDWNSLESPYSFPINPGKHQVKIRTPEFLVTLDEMEFFEGYKTIFSIDLETFKGPMEKVAMEKTLTEQEKRNLYPYIFPLRNSPTTRFAYLEHRNHLHLLGLPGTQYGKRLLSGPIAGEFTYRLLGEYGHTLMHEPGMEYEFQASVVKMREVKMEEFPKHLDFGNRIFPLQDFAWSENRLQQLWEEYLDEKRRQNIEYRYPPNNPHHKGRLVISPVRENSQGPILPIATVLRHKDDASSVWVFPGSSTVFSNLAPGFYEMTLFFQAMEYLYQDSVVVRNNGLSYLRLPFSALQGKDEFSIQVAQTLEQYVFNKSLNISEEQKFLSDLNRSYFSKYPYTGPGKVVSGYVFDQSDLLPLPGAIIQIKGTNYGASTDLNGYFSLIVPYTSNELIVSFIGFSPEQVSVYKARNLSIYLKEDTQALEEIVITGYGGQERRQVVRNNSILYEQSLVAPVDLSTSLQGKVQGVASFPSQLMVRGTAAQGEANPPLVILDGNVFLGEVSTINFNEIIRMEWLDATEAIARFGQAAANGAINILTRAGGSTGIEKGPRWLSEDLWGLSLKSKVSLRQNFSDAAFWQPKLRTDKDGKVSFKTQFPDDITTWQSFYLAMGDQRRSGQTQGRIQAMLPLATQLSVPRFLVQEDSSWVIGKTINYLPKPSEVTRSFTINGLKQELSSLSVAEIQLDSLLVTAEDSLAIEYSLQRADNSYEDGELREIPVFSKGLEKARGHFALLERDTVVSIRKDPNLPFGILFLHADLQSILAEEIRLVHAYKYACTEQLASKLKTLLAAKSLAALKDEPFQQGNDIERIIKLLEKTQGTNGLWGWWEHSPRNLWITQHVLEALFQAKKEGYIIKINKNDLENSLIWELEYAEDWVEKLQVGNSLVLIGATFDMQAWVKMLENSSNSTLVERIRLLELKSRLGIPFDLTELYQYERKSILGNSYFGADDNGFQIVNNDIQHTLLAYQIIKRLKPGDKRLLAGIRNYLLEKRGSFGWTNTFESAQIIETLMEDMTTRTEESGSSMQLVSDTRNERLQLSAKIIIAEDSEIKLIKSGSEPIYYSYFEKYWESNPVKTVGVFEIATTYSNGNQAVWKAGKEVEIQVEVEVKEDASFVMINIPIPGSCSYAEKKSSNRVESHREYFPEQTAIFCEKLPKGNYTFTVSLIPRFEGTYTINPATIELMYFPSIYANADMKKVQVRFME